MADELVVVGVDQSLTSTGLAVIDERGFVTIDRIRSKEKGHERVEEILTRILAHCHDVTEEDGRVVVGIEGLSMGAKGSSVDKIFGLFHVITHRLWQLEIPYYVAPPSTVKLYATGKGNAGKDEVLSATIRRYPDAEFAGNDQADAMNIAALGARHYGIPVESAETAAMARALEKIEWPDV